MSHFQPMTTFILRDLTVSGAFSRFLILRFRETTEYDRVWVQNVKWPTLGLASVFLDRREGWRLFRRQASRENNFDLFSRIRKLGSLRCDSMLYAPCSRYDISILEIVTHKLFRCRFRYFDNFISIVLFR